MAGGPDGDWTVTGPQPPLHFSVRKTQNIRWKTSLPEGGQSGIAIHGELAFLSIMKPWTPKYNPDELKAQLAGITQQKNQTQNTVDREILEVNTGFATLDSLYKSHDKQIDELITIRTNMLLAEDPKQNVSKLRDRVRRFHPHPRRAQPQGPLAAVGHRRRRPRKGRGGPLWGLQRLRG